MNTFGRKTRTLLLRRMPRDCDGAFQLALCLSFLSGFLALVFAGGLHPLLTLVIAPAVCAAYWLPPRVLPYRMQFLVFLVFLALAMASYWLQASFAQATVHLLLAAGLVKLYTRRTDTDYYILVLIAFSFLLLASAYTISVVFLAALVIFLFLSILTLVLFESRESFLRNPASVFRLGTYVRLTAGVTVLIAVIAIPIFVLVPRTSFGFFRDDSQVERLSGFSDEVNLGEMGRIVFSRQVVMRIQLDVPPDQLPPGLKWRGIALDRYDGKTWKNTVSTRRRIPWDPQVQGFLVDRRRQNDRGILSQRVTMELASSVIFGAPDVFMIREEGRLSRFGSHFQDGNTNLFRSPSHADSYVAFSDISSRSEKLKSVSAEPLPDDIAESYLQLPSDLRPKIRQLAVNVTKWEASPLGKALLLESYLRDNYAYSLENKPAASDDPLFDFLFETRAGHCEYFSTAQAILMRTLGIPSRVVNGFQQGEYNRWNGNFLVRQADAHSWVEGYFPGAGWIEFDATPWAPRELSLPALRAAWQFLDALDIFWSEVVTFDRGRQIGLFQSLRLQMWDLWWSLRDSSSSSGLLGTSVEKLRGAASHPWLALLVASLLPCLWLGFRLRRRVANRLRAFFGRPGAAGTVPGYYLEMLEILSRRGMRRFSAETPAEFALRVADASGTVWPARITEIYYWNRFGGVPPLPAQTAEIEEGLRFLRRLGRKERSSAKS